jgi:hypothetical protein
MLRAVFILVFLAVASCALATTESPASTGHPYGHARIRNSEHLIPAHSSHGAASNSRHPVAHRTTLHRAAPHRLAARPSAHPAATAHPRHSATRPPHVAPDIDRAPATQRDDPAPQLVSFSRARHIPVPAPLTGSLASLERQNERTDAEGLERILDDDDLNDRIARKMLVPVPVSTNLAINPDLPANRRYCRPWTAGFLADLARAHAARFHRPLQVSSAVRTVAYQKRLLLVNGNAAAAEGDIVSPHLTGATVDIAKSGLTLQEIAWMRAGLLPLQLAGKIDVEEEFQQACFHITVYKSYLPPTAAPRPRRRIPPGVQIASRGR